MTGKLLFGILLALFITSCSNFKKIEKNEDWRVKYEAALNYYNKKDYYRAAILFEQIRPIVRGLPEGEKVEFYLAYCQYNERTYLLASNQFRVFYETYRRSPLAEEAQFMYAYSLYVSSPVYSLDQQSSIEAMDAMQTFINQYPRSKYLDQAVNVIEDTQVKLERKGYENAKLYLKLKSYKAAILSFNNFKSSFPDSEYLEELSFLKVEAQYKYAAQSFLNLQNERYSLVLEFYQDFIDNFPRSLYIKEAEKYYQESVEKLNKLKTNNS